VERQIGYKRAKNVMAIELVDSFENIGGGKGGYWEDREYEWYAGIRGQSKTVLSTHFFSEGNHHAAESLRQILISVEGLCEAATA